MADLLRLDRVSAGYGPTVVIEDVSLSLGAGEALALIGRNGVGKTTLLSTIAGHTTLHAGALWFDGVNITAAPIWARNRAGLGLVPQEREVFPSLSVMENLSVSKRGTEWSTDDVLSLFPSLAARRQNRGNQLSGGEQQMLAIGRALMGNPRLLLLDEPLEGLAPKVAETVLAALLQLRSAGRLAMILVEQNARLALDFAPQVIALDRGRIVFAGPSTDLANSPEHLAAIVAVSRRPSGEVTSNPAQLSMEQRRDNP
jgi:branched-chain amino acid transport system ATP-binding protein